MTYIYIVYLGFKDDPDYVYVGSHTWDGEGLDPNYHGSCMYNSNQGKVQWDRTWCSLWWKNTSNYYISKGLYLMEILWEYDPRNEPRIERECILQYAEKYGVVRLNLWAYAGYNFKKGKLLNQHANSAEASRTPEAQLKRVNNTDFTGVGARLNTPQARAKSLNRDWHNNMKQVAASRKRNGNCSDMRACHTPEAIAKAELSRDRIAASRKIDYAARIQKYDVHAAQLKRVNTRLLNAYRIAIALPDDHPQKSRRLNRMIKEHPELLDIEYTEDYGVTEDSDLAGDAARGPVAEFE